MANKVIVLNAFCRASFPHLAEPFAHDPKDAEKYRLQLMFAKDNTYDHPEVGEIESHPYEIIDALNEVCLSEFNFGINEIEDVAFLKDEVGVQFPPSFKDGDKIKLKDDKGRPVPGEFDPKSAGWWFLNTTSNEQPGCIGPDENEVDPKTIYSGCWIRVQLEVSAYYNKQNNAPIVNIDLMNVQYCYDDESLGGRAPRQDAKTAFGGRKVENSNVKAGTGTRMGKPGECPSRPGADKPSRPSRPGADKPSRPGADKPSRPSRPGADKPSRPSRPGADKPSRPSRPSKPEPKFVPELIQTGDYDIQELLADGWSEEELISEGYAEWSKPVDKPSRPSRPSKPEPKRKPAGPTVVMFEDSEFSYEDLKAEDWTDEDIVNGGYGEFDYTDPDA